MVEVYSLLFTRFGLCFEPYKNEMRRSDYKWLWWLYEAVKHNMDGPTFYTVFNKFPPGTKPLMALTAPDGERLVNCGQLGWVPKADKDSTETVAPTVTVYFRSRDSNSSIEKPLAEVLKTITELTMRQMVREAAAVPIHAHMYNLLLEKLRVAGTPEFSNIGAILSKPPGSKQELYDSLVSAIHEATLTLKREEHR